MPIPTIIDPGPPLTPRHIEKLESKLGARLPASYRRFLLQNNGGRPEPHYFLSDAMDSFLGICPKDEVNDIWSTRRTLKKRLPAEVLPIADNVFGDCICLAIKGKNRGKVYLWDHEGAPEDVDIRAEFPEIIFNDYTEDERPVRLPTWPGYPDLTLIADSFDEFLQSFHEGTETELPPQPDPDLELVDINLDQLLPSLDEDDELEKPGKSAKKRTAPTSRKKPARSSSKKRTARKKRTSRTSGPRKKRSDP